MAVAPLYNADLETLLEKARINTADDVQTVAVVHQTVTEVRLGFFSVLTKDRAKAIAAYATSDTPDTDEEVLKARAIAVEALWLTMLLAQRLPFLFMDNKASTGDAFNDEPLTRDTQLQDFIDALKAQIDAGLAELMLPPEENAGAVKASLLAPDDPDLIYNRFPGLFPVSTLPPSEDVVYVG